MVGGAIAAPVYWFVIEGNHPEETEEEVGTVQGRKTFSPQEELEA